MAGFVLVCFPPILVHPVRAPVSPRVVSRFSGVPVLLEDDVRECLGRRSNAQICVQGPAGSGKTVALQHLAAVLQDEEVRFFDDSLPDDWLEQADARSAAAVFSARVPVHFQQAFHVCHLAPWSEDDLIEYLLATHRRQCASVIRRLHAAGDAHLLDGIPELCRLVLDHMAGDPRAGGVRDSVVAILGAHVRSEKLLGRICRQCQGLLLEPRVAWMQVREWLTQSAVEEADIKILRHAPVQVLLSAKVLVRDLIDGREPSSPNAAVPAALIEEAGARVAARPKSRDRLEAAFPTASKRDMPTIASVLHRAVDGWIPERPARFFLQEAELSGVAWRGLDLEGAQMGGARFVGADLRRTKLTRANLDGACLVNARLARSDMAGISGRRVDVTGADLTRVRGRGADFREAKATDVEAVEADFRSSRWEGACMSNSSFVGADFSHADLRDTDIDRSDFTQVNFDQATLHGLRMHESLMLGATFRGAHLDCADFECMILPDADFTGASLERGRLTGSVIPDGQMTDANLRNAELADINWEHADLRGADLRGARFHAGTTRNGVHIGGRRSSWEHPPIYPDDEQSQDFLPPEAMRKANLFGADIRGARIDGVDFYLVDLRHAKYDAEQADYLRDSGAILQSQT